jgi:hypothetical protein
MVKGSRWHSGKISAAIMMPPEMLAQRMLGRKLSGGGGSRMAILLMVVRGYHFNRRLVVGRPALKKRKIIEVLPSRGGPHVENT